MNSAPAAERALLVFAAVGFVFHNLPPLAGETAQDYIDLVTPFAVLGAAALVLRALRAGTVALALAFIAAVLYADGHGIHLAANSIANEGLAGDAGDRAHFWDEQLGHVEWHLGWFGLIGAFCLAERERRRAAAVPHPVAAATVALLGFTLFANTVEGGTWWLELAVAVALVAAAVTTRRPLLVTCAAAFGSAAALIGIWALWHGGVPEFSELGWL